MKNSSLYEKVELGFAEDIQKYIIENALEKVYALNKNQTVIQVRDRVINDEKYKEYKKFLKELHKEYEIKEVPYLRGLKNKKEKKQENE